MNKSIRKVKLISRNIFSNRSVLFYIQSIIFSCTISAILVIISPSKGTVYERTLSKLES